jgi:LysM repeat protein
LVTKGESLYGIARRYGLAVQSLRSWNSLRNDVIRPCTTLKLYAPEAEATAAAPETAPEPDITSAPEPAPVVKEEVPTEYKVVAKPTNVKKINCNVEATEGEHVVMQGENLTAIARNYGVKISDLRAWNNLSGDVIQPCQKLAVVGSAAPTVVMAKAPVKPAPKTTVPKGPKPVSYSVITPKQPKNLLKEFTVEATPLPKPIPVKPASAPKQALTAKSPYAKVGTGLHVVQRGETISGLAKKFKMSEGEFRKVNYLGATESIYIGQVLRSESCTCNVQVSDDNTLALKAAPLTNDLAGVPASYNVVAKPKKVSDTEGGVTSKSPDRNARKYHVVQSGETVYSIAKLYKMEIATFRTLNKLDENEVIIPNQLLVLE